MPDGIQSKIVITVGLPGSGKSTYLQRLGVNAISSDQIRRLLADDPTDQSIHAMVFRTIRYLARQRLRIGRPITYVDATHLTRKERKPYLRMGVPVEALFFHTPLEVCIARNAERQRVVPEDAIRKMAQNLQRPSVEEGLSNVMVIAPGAFSNGEMGPASYN